jgi:hypothetical protein
LTKGGIRAITFQYINAFDFFFIRPILGSSSYSTLRLAYKVFIAARHLEQVLKRPLLIPRVGFLKNNNLGRLFAQLEQHLSAIINTIQE